MRRVNDVDGIGLSCAAPLNDAGVSSLAVLHIWLYCSYVWSPMRSFGGGCEQALRKRCQLEWFVLGCARQRSWRLVIRGASSLIVLLICMVHVRPIGRGIEQASGERCR